METDSVASSSTKDTEMPIRINVEQQTDMPQAKDSNVPPKAEEYFGDQSQSMYSDVGFSSTPEGKSKTFPLSKYVDTRPRYPNRPMGEMKLESEINPDGLGVTIRQARNQVSFADPENQFYSPSEGEGSGSTSSKYSARTTMPKVTVPVDKLTGKVGESVIVKYTRNQYGAFRRDGKPLITTPNEQSSAYQSPMGYKEQERSSCMQSQLERRDSYRGGEMPHGLDYAYPAEPRYNPNPYCPTNTATTNPFSSSISAAKVEHGAMGAPGYDMTDQMGMGGPMGTGYDDPQVWYGPGTTVPPPAQQVPLPPITQMLSQQTQFPSAANTESDSGTIRQGDNNPTLAEARRVSAMPQPNVGWDGGYPMFSTPTGTHGNVWQPDRTGMGYGNLLQYPVGSPMSLGNSPGEPQIRDNERIPTVQARDYDGSTPLAEFKKHFLRVAQANRWSEQTAGSMLSLVLTGTAASVVGDTGHLGYKEIMAKLEEAFGPRSDTALAAAIQVRQLKLKPGQSLYALAAEIRHGVTVAYGEKSEEVRECLMIDAFRDSMTEARIVERLLSERPPTLQDAVAIAQKVETLRTAARQVVTPISTSGTKRARSVSASKEQNKRGDKPKDNSGKKRDFSGRDLDAKIEKLMKESTEREERIMKLIKEVEDRMGKKQKDGNVSPKAARGDYSCYRCGEKHMVKECPHTVCPDCGVERHTKKGCPQRQAISPGQSLNE